ncbi:TonB-dependent receptor family protein [Teredinibacter purpureus]|uniref:TonB-dependent receptor family protein n=1 Tax=Teredinibacter purpureus TaxID=2731756 RepID=UPI000A753109|nr:TonB-dependent receptor [Teredinibacter purpureus]
MQLYKYVNIPLCLAFGFSQSVFSETPNNSEILETVLVVGQKSKAEIEQEKALTPGSITLVDGEDLRERNVSNLEDMLRYVPGVWAASGSTGDTSFFSSRGSNLDATHYDGNGVKLLQDGLPVTTADGNNHNRIMDPLSARYAIVAHGANALTYGASTLGGAINFITPTARDSPPEIFFNGGSHGQAQARMTASMVSGDIDGLVTLEAKRWDGYRDHQKQERESIYANAGWKLSDTVHTRLYLTYIDNNQQLPGSLTREELHENPTQAQTQALNGNYQYNVETWRAANKTVWDINENSHLSIGVSYESQMLYHPIVDKIMVDFDGNGPNPPVEVFSLLINTEQNTAGTSLRYNLNAGEHNILAGLNYSNTIVEGGNYRNGHGIRNGLTTRVDNTASSLEVFLVDRWQVAPKWNVVYGVQAISSDRDVKNINNEYGSLFNPKADFQNLNPRVGVLYKQANDVELFANLSRLYEAPTNFELQDDVSPDNKPLDPMQGTVIEVGTRGQKNLTGTTDYWRWDIAVYYGALTDEILSVDDPDAPGTSLSANVDDTVHAGIEALFGASFGLGDNDTSRIEPLLSVTMNNFNFHNDPVYGNNQLPAAPGYAVKGEIIYRNTSGFFAGPTFDVIDKRYADFSNNYVVDSYALLGFRAGLDQNNWEVYGELRNLTDTDYVGTFTVVDIGSPDASILNPGEPRSIYIGLKFRF